MEENYNQIFVQKTKALAVRLINELSEIHIPIKSQLYENRYLDHQHLSHPIIEQCAEQDQKKKDMLKYVLL